MTFEKRTVISLFLFWLSVLVLVLVFVDFPPNGGRYTPGGVICLPDEGPPDDAIDDNIHCESTDTFRYYPRLRAF